MPTFFIAASESMPASACDYERLYAAPTSVKTCAECYINAVWE
jgi:hypothetical protein